ncbi:hypothetical protein COO60DRAFT_1520325 [Scenedesmus sp. NREL 46B-D3]|nr:hypothetical protein COO60DRAFT_1520325 [Scenedesmus sp. NREL 46B-D3]
MHRTCCNHIPNVSQRHQHFAFVMAPAHRRPAHSALPLPPCAMLLPIALSSTYLGCSCSVHAGFRHGLFCLTFAREAGATLRPPHWSASSSASSVRAAACAPAADAVAAAAERLAVSTSCTALFHAVLFTLSRRPQTGPKTSLMTASLTSGPPHSSAMRSLMACTQQHHRMLRVTKESMC